MQRLTFPPHLCIPSPPQHTTTASSPAATKTPKPSLLDIQKQEEHEKQHSYTTPAYSLGKSSGTGLSSSGIGASIRSFGKGAGAESYWYVQRKHRAASFEQIMNEEAAERAQQEEDALVIEQQKQRLLEEEKEQELLRHRQREKDKDKDKGRNKGGGRGKESKAGKEGDRSKAKAKANPNSAPAPAPAPAGKGQGQRQVGKKDRESGSGNGSGNGNGNGSGSGSGSGSGRGMEAAKPNAKPCAPAQTAPVSVVPVLGYGEAAVPPRLSAGASEFVPRWG